MQDIYEYYQRMHHNNIVLAYKGSVSEALLDSILSLAENKLDKIELKTKVKKKIFNILVEILQNIYHHFEKKCKNQDGERSIVFLLYKENFGYRIISGNRIFMHETEMLKERIDSINSMSEEELKLEYRDRLSNSKISTDGGAGLGILDIVRKSGEKINYSFQEINNQYSFFSIEIKISA